MLQKTVSATRVLTKIVGKKNKSINRLIRVTVTSARKAYTQTWQGIFAEIPANVFVCEKACTEETTLVSSKQKVFALIDKQITPLFRITKEIRKRTKKKTYINQAIRLEREIRSIASNTKRLLNDVPDASYRRSCS
jgi:SPX domain protein involved in polyphosphate accumulation